MPGEDKLTHAERIRLESFAQAINSQYVVTFQKRTPAGATPLHEPAPPTMADVFKRAEEIEAWLSSCPT